MSVGIASSRASVSPRRQGGKTAPAPEGPYGRDKGRAKGRRRGGRGLERRQMAPGEMAQVPEAPVDAAEIRACPAAIQYGRGTRRGNRRRGLGEVKFSLHAVGRRKGGKFSLSDPSPLLLPLPMSLLYTRSTCRGCVVALRPVCTKGGGRDAGGGERGGGVGPWSHWEWLLALGAIGRAPAQPPAPTPSPGAIGAISPHAPPAEPPRGHATRARGCAWTRRVRLVRRDGRDVST